MEENRGKKEQARGNTHGPMLHRCPLRVLLRELGGPLGRNQHENDHPAGVHIDGYTEDPSDAKSWADRHSSSRLARNCFRRCHLPPNTLPLIRGSTKRTRHSFDTSQCGSGPTACSACHKTRSPPTA